jgi:hypothetical protein
MSNGKDIYLVQWKLQKDHFEIFDDLEIFAASYPRYSLLVLTDALAFGKTVFENDEARIEKKVIVSAPKPDFPRRFFWEFDFDRINWEENAATVIQRILERGSDPHWQELERYYGKKIIVSYLKERIAFLRDDCIDKASLFFNMNKEEMLCYKRKLSQKIPWP